VEHLGLLLGLFCGYPILLLGHFGFVFEPTTSAEQIGVKDDLRRLGLGYLVFYEGSVGRTSLPGLISTRERVCLDQPDDVGRQECIDYSYGGVCLA
jgi:hypothetical protein